MNSTEELPESITRLNESGESSQGSSEAPNLLEQMSSTYYVSRIFHKFIKADSSIKKIPCRLKFPSRNKLQHITILAKSEEVIDMAKERISDIIRTSRDSMRPNHFICLPVQDSASVGAFKAFKQEVLEKTANNPLYDSIDEDLFIRHCRLHFSFVTLLLADEKEVEEASRLLTTFFIDSEIGRQLSSAPLRITIRGLNTMQKDPKHAHVLYATVHQDGDYERLQAIANALSSIYRERGFYRGVEQKSTADVRLHLTLLNSRYRFEKQLREHKGPKGRKIKNRPFNAEGLLNDFEDYSFAENAIYDTISLCKMSAGDANAFYQTVVEIKLEGSRDSDA